MVLSDSEMVGRQLAESREQFLAYIRRRIQNPALAEDVLQDSLVRALRAQPTLRSTDHVLGWFHRIVERSIIDTYRRRGVADQHASNVDVETLEPPAPTADEETVLCTCFRALLPTLKPQYAELIERLDLANEPSDAVAERLGITPNNLKVRHHRARQALRQRLDETCRTCATHFCVDCTCQTA